MALQHQCLYSVAIATSLTSVQLFETYVESKWINSIFGTSEKSENCSDNLRSLATWNAFSHLLYLALSIITTVKNKDSPCLQFIWKTCLCPLSFATCCAYLFEKHPGHYVEDCHKFGLDQNQVNKLVYNSPLVLDVALAFTYYETFSNLITCFQASLLSILAEFNYLYKKLFTPEAYDIDSMDALWRIHIGLGLFYTLCSSSILIALLATSNIKPALEFSTTALQTTLIYVDTLLESFFTEDSDLSLPEPLNASDFQSDKTDIHSILNKFNGIPADKKNEMDIMLKRRNTLTRRPMLSRARLFSVNKRAV